MTPDQGFPPAWGIDFKTTTRPLRFSAESSIARAARRVTFKFANDGCCEPVQIRGKAYRQKSAIRDRRNVSPPLRSSDAEVSAVENEGLAGSPAATL